MIFLLTSEDKGHLKRLNENKAVVFALKKMFMNVCTERPASYEVNFLAAQRIAINMLYDIFHDLEVIQPDKQTEINRENIV